MDFVFSEEQRMLSDSLRRLVSDVWTHERRRAMRTDGALNTSAWNLLAELGVLGLNISQDYAGFGEDPASLLPVHVELGRGLVGEPVIPSAVMAAALMSGLIGNAAQARWLPQLADGSAIMSLAYLEPGRRYATEPAHTRAEVTASGYRLNGSKTGVWHGGVCTAWIVTALCDNGEPGLFLVQRETSGIVVRDMPTYDGVRCAELMFENVLLGSDALLAHGDVAEESLETALGWGIAALCAQASGAMERLIEITAEYLKTRKQFGLALADFQALQHRMAEMLIAKEMALSMAYVAVAALTEPDLQQRRKMLSSAKIEVARAGRLVGQSAVQLHGGMGMTDELEVGDYFKRLTAIDVLLGDTFEHLRILATLDLEVNA